ncbi:gfo/Idh/MocA family oxidoreductase [Sesbania bispinosa]|nr:gfo/Idh/MocA family oxidoreductase [Sesbania bispinosa]
MTEVKPSFSKIEDLQHQPPKSDSNLASLRGPHLTTSEEDVTRLREERDPVGEANVAKTFYTRRPPRPTINLLESCFLARSSTIKQIQKLVSEEALESAFLKGSLTKQRHVVQLVYVIQVTPKMKLSRSSKNAHKTYIVTSVSYGYNHCEEKFESDHIN